MSEIKLSLFQVECMCHALGIEQWNESWKKSKVYAPYRNYYSSNKPIPQLEELFELGLMGVTNLDNEIIIYRVTQAGVDYLSKLFFKKIILEV